MKGIVFNLLEAIVVQQHGDAVWEALLDEADVDGAYTSLGSYPDEQLFRLVSAAARKLGSSDAEVLLLSADTRRSELGARRTSC